LFHYFPGYTAYDDAAWEVYQAVNAQFGAVVGALAEPGDCIWIHDYHFLLLPQLLRPRLPDASIGFFLHIPFPTYEMYRMLPSFWRTAMLRGLLGADLIGFHTPDDAEYFRTCVARLLGGEIDGETVRVDGRTTAVRDFPISIDVERYAEAPAAPEVQAEVGQLQERLADQKAIISIDRLDYSKGIYQRLLGYQTFLAEHPRWHGRVTFILVVVPSRIGVDQYQRLRQQIDETVGHINGQYGSVHWTPIIYQYRSLPFASLSALYALGDVALITPLRDGMNLVCKEYVAARANQDGVLILSEMAGAAHELTSALLINPNNRREVAGAIAAALAMPAAEQAERMAAMQAQLRANDVRKWAVDFLLALGEPVAQAAE
ncbi:MAG TPA: trehalose-6-phosphate synthase, partial [Herpetosiphonaceae bacterium]